MPDARSVHRNSRMLADAIREVEAETGRDARDVDVAAKLNMDLSEYHQILNDVRSGRMIGIEDLGVTDDALLSDKQDASFDGPFHDIEQDAFQKSLANTIRTLPEREALVLSLYYDEELNLKEIGSVIGVSESRVSQIHSQAMMRLKARMHDWTT